MGRNAKLRHQRRAGASEKTVRVFKSRPEIAQAVPSPLTAPKPSLLGQWFARFKPAPKPSGITPQLEGVNFFDAHHSLLAAMAWEGYHKQGRGLLMVVDAESSFEVEYIPRGRIRPLLRTLAVDSDAARSIAGMVKEYHPETSVLLLFVSQGGAVDMISMPDLQPSPPECYRQRHVDGAGKPQDLPQDL
jgi:hypothetical protein